jgi:hypothetical protein
MPSNTAAELTALIAVLAALLLPVGASAQVYNDQGAQGKVVRIDRNGFKPNAGKITFSEFAVGTKNPSYDPAKYGGDSKGVTVTFAGYFAGQQMGDANVCPAGGAITGCVAGNPRAPLALDQSSPVTFIATDTSAPDSPVLSGTPLFNGPITMLFDQNVAGVGLQGGYFNALKSTAIRAFDRQGRQIGSVVNLAEGIEYMALVTEDGSETIAGLQFSLVGPEPAGFAIDNLSFARRSELQGSYTKPSAPAGPSNTPAAGGGLGTLFKDSKAPAGPAPGPAGPGPATPSRGLKDLFGK